MPAATMETPQAVKKQTFYCRTASLIAYVGETKRYMKDGQMFVDEGPVVRFTPMGNGSQFGWFHTADPQVIEGIMKRRQQAQDQDMAPDILTADEFNEAIKTPEMHLNDLKAAKTEAERKVESQNKLLHKLLKEGKIKAEDLER